MAIEIKNIELLKVLLKDYHIKLIDVLCWIHGVTGALFFTSLYRPDPTSVHGHFRGADLRSRIYSSPRSLAEKINEVWHYDPDRPYLKVAIVHGKGLNEHLHIQVHDNTKYIGGKND